MSQRQPSQLKSSVRSLANKDDGATSGLSLASRKVPDVMPENVVSPSASTDTTAVEQASPQVPATDIPSSASADVSATQPDSGSESDTKTTAAEKVNE